MSKDNRYYVKVRESTFIIFTVKSGSKVMVEYLIETP